ncbi:MAG: hypothetical protein U1D55_00765 [Phycisphaerae bacterium]
MHGVEADARVVVKQTLDERWIPGQKSVEQSAVRFGQLRTRKPNAEHGMQAMQQPAGAELLVSRARRDSAERCFDRRDEAVD